MNDADLKSTQYSLNNTNDKCCLETFESNNTYLYFIRRNVRIVKYIYFNFIF